MLRVNSHGIDVIEPVFKNCVHSEFANFSRTEVKKFYNKFHFFTIRLSHINTKFLAQNVFLNTTIQRRCIQQVVFSKHCLKGCLENFDPYFERNESAVKQFFCLARNIAIISILLGIVLSKWVLRIALTDTYTDKNLILSVFRAKTKNCFWLQIDCFQIMRHGFPHRLLGSVLKKWLSKEAAFDFSTSRNDL